MTQFKKTNHVENTLFDYYQDRLTDAKRAEVERWIAQDDEHAARARQVEELAVCDTILANLDRTDTTQAYIHVENELSHRSFRRDMDGMAHVEEGEKEQAIIYLSNITNKSIN